MTNPSKFLPVIHVEGTQQAILNVAFCQQGGADGCFLINHGISPADLYLVYRDVREQFPNFWIGLNFLGIPEHRIANVMKLNPSINGIWIDNLGVDDDGVEPYTTGLYNATTETLKLFGGVAFKYQKQVKDLASIADLAQIYCDVTTTSGPGTGEPPSVDKVKIMKGAAPTQDLALASGVDLENIHLFLPFVDYFLVATGISESFYMLDPYKVKKMADIIHAYKD